MCKGEPYPCESHGGAQFQVADQVFLRHRTARLPGVAVEKDVAGDGPSIDADKYVSAEVARRLEEIRSRQARLYPQGSKIVGQIETQPRHRTGIDVVIDIADGTAEMRLQVEIESKYRLRRNQFETAS